MDEFHPEIKAAAKDILDENGPKADIVISTGIMVICSLISLGLQCYRWRTEGIPKTASDAEVAERMRQDMNKLPNYDPATDSFNPQLVKRMAHQAKRAARKKHERIGDDEAHELAIRALRKAQRGASAEVFASLPPDSPDEDELS